MNLCDSSITSFEETLADCKIRACARPFVSGLKIVSYHDEKTWATFQGSWYVNSVFRGWWLQMTNWLWWMVRVEQRLWCESFIGLHLFLEEWSFKEENFWFQTYHSYCFSIIYSRILPVDIGLGVCAMGRGIRVLCFFWNGNYRCQILFWKNTFKESLIKWTSVVP